MDLSLYDTYTMLTAVQKTRPVQRFLTNTFFPGVSTFATETVMFDYQKGGRPMAPFVAPRVGGITVARDGYKTKTYTAPKIAPQRALTLDDLVIRGIGENLFSQRTPAERQNELLAKDMLDLENMIARRTEWMARQLLLGNAITVKGFIDKNDKDYIEDTIDFGFTNKTTLSGTAMWSNAGSEKTKYEQLRAWKFAVQEASDENVDMVIFGIDAWKYFRQDPEIQIMLNNINGQLINLQPSIRGGGLTFCGTLPELGLEMYTYNSTFLDDDGTTKKYIPDNTLVMASKNLGSFSYGAVTQMEADGQFHTYQGDRIPKSWADQNTDTRMIRLTSRPIPVPRDVDSWYVAVVS